MTVISIVEQTLVASKAKNALDHRETKTRDELHKSIIAFKIDHEEVAFTFTQRLARENRWTISYTTRVILEYKRFLILLLDAGHPVTPSDQVDQAWHLHLTYTLSYWDRLCRDTIGRPLHHNPTQGGSAESEKFKIWYQRTLDSYRRIFDELPPMDIWPEPALRFHANNLFQKVEARSHWSLKKVSMKKVLVLVATGLVLYSGVGIVSAAFDSAPRGYSHDNNIYLLPFMVFYSVIVWLVYRYVLAKSQRCEKCGKNGEVFRTGVTEVRKKGETWHELSCKKCKSTFWVHGVNNRSGVGSGVGSDGGSDGGGDGAGCGGCGGCGG